MKPAKRVSKVGMWFKGPHSPDLFKALYVEPEEEFDAVVIGTGASKAVAAAYAIGHLRGKGFGPVFDQIEDTVEHMLPKNASFIEGDDFTPIYCILGVSAER